MMVQVYVVTDWDNACMTVTADLAEAQEALEVLRQDQGPSAYDIDEETGDLIYVGSYGVYYDIDDYLLDAPVTIFDVIL